MPLLLFTGHLNQCLWKAAISSGGCPSLLHVACHSHCLFCFASLGRTAGGWRPFLWLPSSSAVPLTPALWSFDAEIPITFSVSQHGLTFLRIHIRRLPWSGWQVTCWLMASPRFVGRYCSALNSIDPRSLPAAQTASVGMKRWWVMAPPPCHPSVLVAKKMKTISLWCCKT